ncbi:hypothetical protein V6N11_050160 [Hibiscus sabdariffa]|uniref:Uncharacterized protein n=2 Tax=Hibiscus sabdariffa TaxID=183260 RepID=A0ABR2AKX7_9ROSI
MPPSCYKCHKFGHVTKYYTEEPIKDTREWEVNEPKVVSEKGESSSDGGKNVSAAVVHGSIQMAISIGFATEALEIAAHGDVSVSLVGASTELEDPNLQEFPHLQASNKLREKMKVRGKGVKLFSSFKNKLDMLSSLENEVHLEMVRQPRAASQGVANLMKELKN